MALAEYRRKRRFDTTPEPKGETRLSSGRGWPRFVVQKHQARRLHYDFRLEADGVLKSWAVPKGPSCEPGDKRLAVMVEDHPLEYAEFEGRIPSGNYGAGSVMVWDRGTYGFSDESDDAEVVSRKMNEGLGRGELKITLNGQKLSGSWVLVRTDDARSWLMIRHRDGGSRCSDDDEASALSGRTMEEIASADAVWMLGGTIDLAGAPEEAQPDLLAPMLAYSAERAFDDKDWLYELKWDGYRIMAHMEGSKVRLMTRGNQDYTERYPMVTSDLAGLGLEGIVDGEMVVLKPGGQPDFVALQDYAKSPRGDLVYYVFDLPYFMGRNIEGLALTKRREILQKLVEPCTHVRLSDHIRGSGGRLFELAKEQQLEGIMAKRASSPYRPGRRSRDWLRIKAHHRQEAVIAGFTEPRGGRKWLGSLILGLYEPDGRLRYIGHAGTGLGDKELLSVYQHLSAFMRESSPLADGPSQDKDIHWVEPKLLAEVSFSEWTNGGLLRQPVFIGLRDDKPAREVTREEPSKTLPGQTPIGHADKVFWPTEQITKGDLAEYYQRISHVILPYLADRPQSLHRQPDGINGPDFFQKDLRDGPDWIRRVTIRSESSHKDVHWVICDDERTLEYLVNLGCIELNPWLSRASNLERPDFCLIDLDAKTNSFSDVVTVATTVQAVCDGYGVPTYPKTSGKTGMHVAVPLGGRYSFEQSRQFAQLICSLVHARLPKLTSLTRNPDKRRGFIYLDFLQNRPGQTMACAYSVRPLEKAPVSTPLAWSEVTSRLDPQDYTLRNMHQRLASVGDLWAPIIGEGINLSKILGQMSPGARE